MKKLLVFIILILGISTSQAQQEKIVEVPDINPEFVGGIEKLFEYLEENLNYPEMAKENGIQGKVFIQFDVWKDGDIKNVEVLKGVHETLDSAAVRVVKTMPKWTPGYINGEPVNSRFTLPLSFKITSKDDEKSSKS